MLDRISFLMGEAFIALRRNVLMTFAAVSTVAISLFLLGGLGYAYVQISSYIATFPERLDMRIYLKEDVSKAQVGETAKLLRAIPGVKAAMWIPRDKAWQKEKLKYPAELVADLDNPLPEAFKVTMADPKMADSIATAIRGIPSVDKQKGIVYQADVLQLAGDTIGVIRWLGVSVGGLLFLTAGLLIYNAIRLTVLSRRLEIRIMQLVGASIFTIRIPFLLEGILQGVLGGGIATGLLWIGHLVLSDFLAKNTLSMRGLGPFPSLTMGLILCAAGAIYGLLCSTAAVRTPLRFR